MAYFLLDWFHLVGLLHDSGKVMALIGGEEQVLLKKPCNISMLGDSCSSFPSIQLHLERNCRATVANILLMNL